MGDWCYAAPWIRKATNLQYYRWRDTTHSREEVAQATDYGGWLMVWYQDAVEKNEMPSGMDEDFRAWMLHINRMQEEGHKIGDYTDAVLAHCRE
ncbi:hypothetical protein ABZU86_13420 [Streptomyces sp. NPDC005271]|uniref:hypothetical protein n=1 Tax=unclassified Streptomyces TaxID=2593676 RepID=UPI0033B7CD46